MSSAMTVWIIVAACLILIGCVVFVSVMTALKWDFTKLSTNKYETNSHEIGETFHSISVETDTSDVVFVPSEDASATVVCYEEKKVTHTVTVRDGVLEIKLVDARKWYEKIGIHFGSPKMTVSLPRQTYEALTVKLSTGRVEIPKELAFESLEATTSTGSVSCSASVSDCLKIKTSTGKISLEELEAGSITLSVSTGRVTVRNVRCAGEMSVRVSTGDTELTDVSCGSLVSKGSTGNISMQRVIVTEAISIERSTGDVRFDASDAATITVKTDTGSVKGSLLTDKLFVAHSDTGKVVVPKDTTGGRCEVTTDTGSIILTVS